MITSYVTPQCSMLYLSLVGPLDRSSSEQLVNEYYERQTPGLRQCILDLATVDQADQAGLSVLHRLSLLAQVDGLDFSLVAQGSGVESDIAEAARRFWVPLVDRRNLPFAEQETAIGALESRPYSGGSFSQT
jgi:ABC-type transporter Mla MlaB component